MFFYFRKTKGKLKLLRINRGYQNLKNSDNLELIDNLKNTLTHTKLFNTKSSKIFSVIHEDLNLEICVRQYLLQRYVGLDFNREFLASYSCDSAKFAHPIPNIWLNVLIENGVNVNIYLSRLLWYVEILKLLCFGVFEILKQIISSINYNYGRKCNISNRYVYFDSLSPNNIPQKSGSYRYGILPWFLNYYGNENLDFIAHSVKGEKSILFNGVIEVKYLSQPFPPISPGFRAIKFLFKSILLLLGSIFYLLIGKWWYAVLIREFILSEVVKYNNGDGLAKKYFFNNSKWIYRPLWTYSAQNFDSEIIFYFYSTNIERFYKSNKISNVVNGWEIITWSKILIWDEFQLKFLKNNVISNKCVYEITGPIEFQSSNGNSCSIPYNSIAVFDVQPVRSTYYESLGLDQEYYVPEVANAFLLEVFETITTLNLPIAFKRKRNIGKLAHYKYSNEINRISNEFDFLNIDPSIPAELIISNAKAVISMPFTSTALVGKHLGKPSIFYDPTGLLIKDDPAAHGIRVINNKDDLKDWLITI
ncbi:polysaccharide biosynthesis PFTS motif protein [Aquirufa antheringensis]